MSVGVCMCQGEVDQGSLRWSSNVSLCLRVDRGGLLPGEAGHDVQPAAERSEQPAGLQGGQEEQDHPRYCSLHTHTHTTPGSTSTPGSASGEALVWFSVQRKQHLDASQHLRMEITLTRISLDSVLHKPRAVHLLRAHL